MTSFESGPQVRVIASPSSWIEGEALRQLDMVSALPGMVSCVGMPDLHPGKGWPVGAAFLSRDIFYPHLVGNDIGCGMGLWATDVPLTKGKPDRLAARMNGFDQPLDDDGEEQRTLLAERGLPDAFALSLGTPGRGNHFIEIQRIHQMLDADAVKGLGFKPDRLVVLVHTGSRGLGEAVLRHHTERFGAGALRDGSPEADDYLARHAHAVAYAELNRKVCAHRTLAAMGGKGQRVLDLTHNLVSRIEAGWLHRKGAAPADAGPVVIPGSRGDLTYLVQPLDAGPSSLFSLAHGAGRKMARREAKGKLQDRLRRDGLRRNPFGGQVVCGDERLLWEEAPECYKPVARVIQDLEDAGLVRVLATLAPVVTFKTSMATTESRRGR